MNKLFLLIFLFGSSTLFSQGGSTISTGGRSNGVATASVGFTDINSIFNNQAGLAEIQTMGIVIGTEKGMEKGIELGKV